MDMRCECSEQEPVYYSCCKTFCGITFFYNRPSLGSRHINFFIIYYIYYTILPSFREWPVHYLEDVV